MIPLIVRQIVKYKRGAFIVFSMRQAVNRGRILNFARKRRIKIVKWQIIHASYWGSISRWPIFITIKPPASLYKHRRHFLAPHHHHRYTLWRRVLSGGSSQYVRPNPLPEDPASPLALYFAIRTNISSPAAPRDLGAERLINAPYDELAPGLSDSHSTRRLPVIYRPDSRVCIQAPAASSGFSVISRHRYDLVPRPAWNIGDDQSCSFNVQKLGLT